MTVVDLVQEIKTLSPKQLESVYSFVHSLKQDNIEPFASERETLDFVNYYAERILNEAG